MKWKEIKVLYNGADLRIAEELIADAFMAMGLQGVVIEDSRIEPVDGFFDDDFIRNRPPAVIGYLPATGEQELLLQRLQEDLRDLAEREQFQVAFALNEIDEEDWAESWKAYFWPEKVGETVVVKPTWREYQENPGDIVIEIDPGMAFGTGAHPTTALCIRMLEKYVVSGGTVIDIGTGSGILMIAAAKLGAAQTFGIDRDPLAVAIAEQNLRLNRIDPGAYAVIQGNLIASATQRFDLAVANILTDTILELLTSIETVLKPTGGIFICSGIIEKNRRMVADAMKAQGFHILEMHTREEWAVIVGQTAKATG